MSKDARLINERDPERLRLEIAVRAVVICTYQVGEHRNTWGGVCAYQTDRCFLDIESAKARAETERKRGSDWRIRELPACAFIGERESLIIADASVEPLRPMRFHKYDTSCPPYLGAIADKFVVAGFSPVRLITHKTGFGETARFGEWASLTRGGRYRLKWFRTARDDQFDLSGIEKIVSIHRASLHSLAFWGVVRSESPEGARVRQLHPRSPLVRAGIAEGEIVTHVDNVTQDLREVSLETAISCGKPGDLMVLRREGKLDTSFQLVSFGDAITPSEPRE